MSSATYPPEISIIVPCYNEARTIAGLLDAIRRQSLDLDLLEVIVADGGSQDSTRDVIQAYKTDHPELQVRLVDNPQRNIPAALNHAIRAALGSTVVRLDAHSAPAEDYVARCLQALAEGKGTNVGGVWQIEPGGVGWMARAIAAAAAHPLGVGDAQYRHAQRAQEVDTVPFGAFRKNLIDQIGLFDESLLTNEDYEFNVRIRQHGGRIWLDPEIKSSYFARRTLGELLAQYWRYGYWKARMIRRYPETLRWRQFLPPAFVLSLLGLAVLTPFLLLAKYGFVVVMSIYLSSLVLVSLQQALLRKDLSMVVGLPAAIMTMHFAWGSAFLVGLPKKDRRANSREQG